MWQGRLEHFPKIHRLKRTYYETWPDSLFRLFCPGFDPFDLFFWSFLLLFGLHLAILALLWPSDLLNNLSDEKKIVKMRRWVEIGVECGSMCGRCRVDVGSM